MSYADFLRAKRARAAKVGQAFSDADIMTKPCHADVLLELASAEVLP